MLTQLAQYGGIVGLQELDYDRRREGPRWQKILYERQPFPDNYTDHTFLIGLKRNGAQLALGLEASVRCRSTTGTLLTTMLSKHSDV